MSRRLTAFQLLMRGWSELYPYNFIHALRFEGPAQVPRWHDSIQRALRPLGLSAPLARVSGNIDEHLDLELNRAFAPQDPPLRFFLLETDGGYWLGATIDHWLADDFSARALLQQICMYYRGQGEEVPLLRAGRPQWRGDWIAEWRSFFSQAGALRRTRRPSLADPLDFRMESFHTELPAAALESARRLAKEQQATVHDVFLAATAQACAMFAPAATGTRRDGVGVATAMDVRRFETPAERNSFGLFISEYSIVERRPEEFPLPVLVGKIATKTRRWKALSGRAALAGGLLLWRLSLSRRMRATVFVRGAPLLAGISNVNLTGSWLEKGALEFRRIAPTGPVVPLVLMVTTRHGRIFIDTTYRTTAFSRGDAKRLVQQVAERLVIR